MKKRKVKNIDLLEIQCKKKEDLDEILKIEKVCFSISLSKESFVNEFSSENTYYFSAFYNKELCGYISFLYLFDEIEIISLAVHPDNRNLGIASNLLNRLCEFVRKNNVIKIFLEVRMSNEIAQKLYKNYGFKQINIRKNYYSNDLEDAVVMVCNK